MLNTIPRDLQKRMKRYGTSLCFYCKNARPSCCPWIRNGEKIFIHAEVKLIDMSEAKIPKSRRKDRKHRYLVESIVVRNCPSFVLCDDECKEVLNEATS